MTNQRYFLLAIMLAFIGLVGNACSAPGIVDTSASSTSSPATEINITPSITLSPTPLPTLSFVIPGTQYPTATPYLTASTVKTNAVAFIDRVGVDYSLWIVNMDGSGERKLADLERNAEWVSQHLLSWSPDGKWIGYISGDDLWITSPNGSVKRRILSIQDTSKKIVRQYAWSPDSSKIAYALAANWGDFTEIKTGLIDLTTGKDSELSVYQSPVTVTVSWSPNGRYLLLSKARLFFVFEVNAGKFIEEIKTDGDCPSSWHDGVVWSPNGEQFYHTHHGTGGYSLWTCLSGLDASNRRISVDGAASLPVWDKTGDFLYFVVGELSQNIGPNLYTNQKLIRYDIAAREIKTLLSLEENGPTGWLWSVSISPNGRMLELYTYVHYEDTSHPGQIYVDASRPKQNKFIILDIQSMSTTKFTLEFQGEINRSFPPPIWSPDNQKIIFFLRNLVRQSYGISFSDSGSFYSLDIKTGKAELFSGVHAVENAIISPIAISP